MSRYERSYSGERRSYGLRVQLTPSEGAEQEAVAELVGASSLSVYVRELLFHRSAVVVAGVRRNPEAKAIMDAMNAAGHQLQAIGNNLNQQARHANTTGELGAARLAAVDDALALYRQWTERHIAALDRVLSV